MAIKDKFVGLILIVVGALPFLLKIDNISEFVNQYTFLKGIVPGSIIYQAIIIILGILLIWKLRHSFSVAATR